MTQQMRQQLHDIVISCDTLMRHTAGVGYAGYRQNALLRDAVARRLDLIGEALRRAEELDPKIAALLPEGRRFIGFSNRLRHDDDVVPDDIAWVSLHRDVPELRGAAASLMKRFPGAPVEEHAGAPIIDPLAGKHEAIAALCREYGVERFDLFGSAAKGTFHPETSDLDFVMTFEDRGLDGYAKRYFGFVDALESLFGRSVDLIFDDAIQNPYFREEIEETRRMVYDAAVTPTAA